MYMIEGKENFRGLYVMTVWRNDYIEIKEVKLVILRK